MPASPPTGARLPFWYRSPGGAVAGARDFGFADEDTGGAVAWHVEVAARKLLGLRLVLYAFFLRSGEETQELVEDDEDSQPTVFYDMDPNYEGFEQFRDAGRGNVPADAVQAYEIDGGAAFRVGSFREAEEEREREVAVAAEREAAAAESEAAVVNAEREADAAAAAAAAEAAAEAERNAVAKANEEKEAAAKVEAHSQAAAAKAEADADRQAAAKAAAETAQRHAADANRRAVAREKEEVATREAAKMAETEKSEQQTWARRERETAERNAFERAGKDRAQKAALEKAEQDQKQRAAAVEQRNAFAQAQFLNAHNALNAAVAKSLREKAEAEAKAEREHRERAAANALRDKLETENAHTKLAAERAAQREKAIQVESDKLAVANEQKQMNDARHAAAQKERDATANAQRQVSDKPALAHRQALANAEREKADKAAVANALRDKVVSDAIAQKKREAKEAAVKAQRQASQSAAVAQREAFAFEKAEREKVDKAAVAKALREVAERLAKAEREKRGKAAAKALREKDESEKAEKVAAEKAAQKEKAAAIHAERDKLAVAKAEEEAAKKASENRIQAASEKARADAAETVSAAVEKSRAETNAAEAAPKNSRPHFADRVPHQAVVSSKDASVMAYIDLMDETDSEPSVNGDTAAPADDPPPVLHLPQHEQQGGTPSSGVRTTPVAPENRFFATRRSSLKRAPERADSPGGVATKFLNLSHPSAGPSGLAPDGQSLKAEPTTASDVPCRPLGKVSQPSKTPEPAGGGQPLSVAPASPSGIVSSNPIPSAAHVASLVGRASPVPPTSQVPLSARTGGSVVPNKQDGKVLQDLLPPVPVPPVQPQSLNQFPGPLGGRKSLSGSSQAFVPMGHSDLFSKETSKQMYPPWHATAGFLSPRTIFDTIDRPEFDEMVVGLFVLLDTSLQSKPNDLPECKLPPGLRHKLLRVKGVRTTSSPYTLMQSKMPPLPSKFTAGKHSVTSKLLVLELGRGEVEVCRVTSLTADTYNDSADGPSRMLQNAFHELFSFYEKRVAICNEALPSAREFRAVNDKTRRTIRHFHEGGTSSGKAKGARPSSDTIKPVATASQDVRRPAEPGKKVVPRQSSPEAAAVHDVGSRSGRANAGHPSFDTNLAVAAVAQDTQRPAEAKKSGPRQSSAANVGSSSGEINSARPAPDTITPIAAISRDVQRPTESEKAAPSQTSPVATAVRDAVTNSGRSKAACPTPDTNAPAAVVSQVEQRPQEPEKTAPSPMLPVATAVPDVVQPAPTALHPGRATARAAARAASSPPTFFFDLTLPNLAALTCSDMLTDTLQPLAEVNDDDDDVMEVAQSDAGEADDAEIIDLDGMDSDWDDRSSK